MKERPLTFKDLRPRPESYREEIRLNPHPVALLLDQIGDPKNLGALFRTADAVRAKQIFAFRMDGVIHNPKVRRVARSSQQSVAYREIEHLEEVQALRSYYQMIGLEWTNASTAYTEYAPQKPTLLVIGNEERGISPDLLQWCEGCVHIPMYGFNTSMNVAVATGIVLYKLLEWYRAGW